MKPSNSDTQKASELLRKLQAAVLSSGKKERREPAPDQDELDFQNKLAGLLSNLNPVCVASIGIAAVANNRLSITVGNVCLGHVQRSAFYFVGRIYRSSRRRRCRID